MGFDSERALLEKMGVEAEIPDSGCCGMAGSFGYEAGERYEVSMACAERVLLPKVREAREETVILADGFSCREQIEQGTGVRPLHLAEMIRDAMSPTRLSELHKRSVNGKAPAALGAAEVALLGAGLAAFGGAIALQRLNSNGGNR
jgi:hypothetical protein